MILSHSVPCGFLQLFRRHQMVEHAPLVRPLGIQLAGIGEFQRPPQPDHLGKIVGTAVLDDLSGIVIGDEPRPLAADADVAMQRHVHARPDRRPVDHRDGRLADQRNIPVKFGEAMKEMLACPIGPFMRRPVARKILARDVRRRPGREIRAGTESPPHAGQHDHANIRVIVSRPHVFAHFRDGAVLLRAADQRVHPVRAIEFYPEDAAVLRLIEQMFDKPWSHDFPPSQPNPIHVVRHWRNVSEAH